MKKEISYKELVKAQRTAVNKAKRINNALNLPSIVVRNGNLISVNADGTQKIMRKASFGTIRLNKRKFRLTDE